MSRHTVAVIQACSSNAVCDDIETIDWLIRKFPNAKVEPSDCLGRCGICEKYAYFLINGKFLYASTVEELKTIVEEYMETLP